LPGKSADKGGSMNNYLLLAVCFLLGILLRWSGRLPDNAAAALNGFVVNVSLPALTLTYVHGLRLQTDLILPALMAWVMFGIGCGFFWLAAKAFGFSRATTGALTLTGGNIDRPVRIIFRTLNPGYPRSLDLLLRPQH
jgi:malate permease and related proteins